MTNNAQLIFWYDHATWTRLAILDAANTLHAYTIDKATRVNGSAEKKIPREYDLESIKRVTIDLLNAAECDRRARSIALT